MGGARQTILSVYWCGDWRMGNFLSNDAQPFHNPVREGLPTILELSQTVNATCS
jgi:hypothetical protein